MKVSSIWFDAPHVRWGRVVATAAIVFMPLLGWMAYERGLFDAGVGDAGLGDEPAEPLARDAAAASPLSLVRTVARTPARVAATARASASASAPASAVRLADVSDTCRAGSTKAERDLPRAWLAAAAASPDVQVQAAAALMAGVEAPQRDTRDTRDRLARLAIESRDPVVYAFAMQRCRADAAPTSGRLEAGACQLLSHEQWASVDADNAVPWLALADAVVARGGDPSDAMFRAAQTRSVRSHRAAVLGAMLSVQPTGTQTLERLRVSDEAFRLQSSWSMPGAALPVFCSASALGDSNRRLACESLAQLLASHGDTLGDLMAARSLGERLGWSADRLAALKTERDVLAALYPAAAEIGEPTGCAAAEARLRFGTQAAKTGELGTLRDWQRRSGRSTAATAQ